MHKKITKRYTLDREPAPFFQITLVELNVVKTQPVCVPGR
uniref:Uncharacterized protein n=1 Tax=uncultured Desulfobacterium sp. TaxID=201089 RepID=E1YIP7_9BACT|nr:unknown protein [uncultured Desulfobacterium sp.]